MALRWKKNPRPTGLAGVCAGPRGSTLRLGDMRCAMVSSHGRDSAKWYWVAGWEARESGVPHKNTCSEPPLSEAEAKAAAMAYVREHLKKAAPTGEPS